MADGREWKYAGDVKAWPASSEPTTPAVNLHRLPSALSGKSACAAPVMAIG